MSRLLIMLLLGITICSGCKTFYTVRQGNSIMKGRDKSIRIDSSYKLYIRKKFANPVGLLTQTNHSKTTVANERENLIEVEYLLLSEERESCIYLTTIPDKYRHYYENNYLGDQYINIYDLRLFFMGEFNADDMRCEFRSKNKKNGLLQDIWLMSFNTRSDKDTIYVDEIRTRRDYLLQEIYPISEVLEEPIVFIKVKEPSYPKLVFKGGKNSKLGTEMINVLGNMFYIDRYEESSFSVYFKLENESREILFNDKRIKYLPPFYWE